MARILHSACGSGEWGAGQSLPGLVVQGIGSVVPDAVVVQRSTGVSAMVPGASTASVVLDIPYPYQPKTPSL